MQLTHEEKRMLQGDYGKGTQFAMELLVKVGDLYGASRFLPVKKAHIDSAAYETLREAGSDFLDYLAENGAKVRVPTTMNPLSRDVMNCEKFGISEDIAQKSKRVEDAYQAMGVLQTWTCASYQTASIPRFGEVISWSESNEVNFVNSVLGARAERIPDMMDVCCAIAGRVPEFGLYLTENRRGDMLFQLDGFGEDWFQDCVDFALLGYYVGKKVVNKVPVIQGLPDSTTSDDLKALSAAAASGGAVGLFHVVGITPEAATLDAAFQGWDDYPVVTVTPQDLMDVREELNTAEGDQVAMVLLGCPHLSVNELQEVAQLLDGRTVHPGTEFMLMTSQAQYTIAKRSGIIDQLEAAGVAVTQDTCLMTFGLVDRWRGQNFVTNSGKIATYAPAVNGTKIYMDSTRNCVEAAVSGLVQKGSVKW